jgi:DNA/RNA endonuclease G (NUC1)
MIPQTHRLNAGDWKSLETATRNWALISSKVRVWSGAIGEQKKIGTSISSYPMLESSRNSR